MTRETKFKVGDLVRVGVVQGSRFSVSDMFGYSNRVGKITQIIVNYEEMYRIEGCDEWCFAGEILTLLAEDNQKYIQGFLAGQDVEVGYPSGFWSKIDALTRENVKRPMRFVKNSQVIAIEKEIDALEESLEEALKKKKEMFADIKRIKSSISRKKKKIEQLS